MRHCAPCIALAAVVILAATQPLGAQAPEPPKFWRVTGVASNDVLHLRDVPSADSRSLQGIPPLARGIKHIGCRRNQPPFEQLVRMTKRQRAEAETEWCRVEYRGKQGWVARRFIKPDDAPR